MGHVWGVVGLGMGVILGILSGFTKSTEHPGIDLSPKNQSWCFSPNCTMVLRRHAKHMDMNTFKEWLFWEQLFLKCLFGSQVHMYVYADR